MKKLAIAGASLALAAMPVVGVFAADTTTVTDNLNVTIADTCTVSTSTYGSGSTGNQWGTQTGTAGTDASISNTWTLAIANNATATSPTHTIAIMCNKTSGWTLKAQNDDKLYTGQNKTGDDIAYSTSAAQGTEGYYVSVSDATDGTISTDNVSSGKMNDLNAGAATIFSKNGSTATASVNVSYTVGTSTTTEAGTYTGKVVYTLAPNV